MPKEILPDATRSKLTKAFDQLDQLLFLDATHELAVDRSTFIKLVTNEEFVPKELRDITLVETSKYMGRRIKERGNGRRIPWHEGEKYGLPRFQLSRHVDEPHGGRSARLVAKRQVLGAVMSN